MNRRLTLGTVLVWLYATVNLLPMLWMFMSSLKTNREIATSPLGLPTTFDFSVFAQAWEMGGLGTYAVNSAIVTFTSTAITLTVSSMAGFALSKLNFRGHGVVLGIFTLGLLLPIQAYFIAQNELFELVYLKDTRWALIVPYTAMGIPLAVWLLKSYMDSLPKEIFESARVDGASDLAVYRLLMVPIIRPALVTVGIFSVLSAWNEFLLALLYVQDDALKTIPTGLLAFSSKYVTDYQMLFAALSTVTLPMIVLYIVFNRQIVTGLTQGSIKG